ncbi:MAG: flavodoxin [Candidatus Hydrogenedentes bacterium]|nr:flavodoxin [Candidatus Hydrogenedentota bacterium]
MVVVKLFYGSSTGNTRHVAYLIKTVLGNLIQEVRDIAESSPEDLRSADLLILGVSTWEQGGLQRDWADFLPHFEEIDLHGKKVALFGLGDAHAFSGLFVHALRTLHDKVKERGAEVIGAWPTDGYSFEYSAAADKGYFAGLVIDEDNQSDMTVKRVADWAALIKPHITGKQHRDDETFG